jgi:hypothetical protein
MFTAIISSGILSLSSPAPPFEELMVLWDFLFAYGVHWNVLAVVAQVLLIREQVLVSDTYAQHGMLVGGHHCTVVLLIPQSNPRSFHNLHSLFILHQCMVFICSPKHILDYRKWPSLRARSVVSMILHMLPKLPVDLRKRIEKHATDASVCSAILGRPVHADLTAGQL